MKRVLACIALTVSCVSPSRARFLGGGYVSVEEASDVDAVCRARVAAARVEPMERLQLAAPTAPVTSSGAGSGASASEGAAEGAADVAGGASYTLDGGPLGQLRVDVRGALGLGAAGTVEAPPPVAFAQLAVPAPTPVRGFLYGVDLRVYRKIVFIVDAGGDMCSTPGAGGKPPIDVAADELIAAISGLPSDTEFLMMSTAAAVRTFAPGAGDDGRRAAMQWTCNLFCIADTSLSVALLDAFGERPDVVVVLSTNGAAYQSGQGKDYLDRDLQLSFVDPANVLERVSGSVPVIAVDLGRGSPHLAAIAERTGGVVVRP